MATASSFWENGLVVVPDFLDAGDLDFVAKSMETSRRLGKMVRKDEVVPQGAEDEYGPVAGELMLRHYRAKVEAVTGRGLLETFAYWRIYSHGAELVRHVDREAAEINVAITIKTEPDGEAWPLFTEDLKGAVEKHIMRPGTALVYQGTKIPHWREPLAAEGQWQLFLMYVFKDGDHADKLHDGRTGGGLTRSPTR